MSATLVKTSAKLAYKIAADIAVAQILYELGTKAWRKVRPLETHSVKV